MTSPSPADFNAQLAAIFKQLERKGVSLLEIAVRSRIASQKTPITKESLEAWAKPDGGTPDPEEIRTLMRTLDMFAEASMGRLLEAQTINRMVEAAGHTRTELTQRSR